MSVVCSICQERITDRPHTLREGQELVVVALECGHIFHKCCAERWFQQRQVCPCCTRPCRLIRSLRIYLTCDEYNFENEATKLKVATAKNKRLTRDLSMKENELKKEIEEHDDLKMEHAKLLSTHTNSIENLRRIVENLDEEKEEVQIMVEEYSKELMELKLKEYSLTERLRTVESSLKKEENRRKLLEVEVEGLRRRRRRREEDVLGKSENAQSNSEQNKILAEEYEEALDDHGETSSGSTQKLDENDNDFGNDNDESLELGLEHFKRGFGIMKDHVLSFYSTKNLY